MRNFFYLVRKYALFTAALLCAGIGLSFVARSAQQSERLFTQAQAERGKPLYAQHCASCHGQSLEGSPSSPLVGERFMAKWNERTLDELYYITKLQMPYGKPDSLSVRQYLDITAFMLASNGYSAGPRELTEDAALMKRSRITRQSGAPAVATSAPVFFNSGAKASSSKPTQSELNAAQSATDWLMPNHDYGGQRFVDLKQINRRNAASLQPVAIYQVADASVFHNNPLVYQGVLYVPVSNPAPDFYTDSRFGSNLYTNSLLAFDVCTGKLQWHYQAVPADFHDWDWNYESQRPLLAAVTTTSAELIFTGELTGNFIALDARNGDVLYRFNVGGPINGGVITYAINGRQYVAVNSGNASGFWRAQRGSATVLLFALPESKP